MTPADQIAALPKDVRDTIEGMSDGFRATFLEALEAITSPGQMASIVVHLQKGYARAALTVALAPAYLYAKHDMEIALAYASGINAKSDALQQRFDPNQPGSHQRKSRI